MKQTTNLLNFKCIGGTKSKLVRKQAKQNKKKTMKINKNNEN